MSDDDDIVERAEESQSATISENPYSDPQPQNPYCCSDKLEAGTVEAGEGNEIYIATTDKQHDAIVQEDWKVLNPDLDNEEEVKNSQPLSGWFTNETTIEACKTEEGSLDASAYNEATQVAPYYDSKTDECSYKSNVDCFRINEEKMQENYGTTDFNAAIGYATENNQFGAGGAPEGYSSKINEMIENGSLEHVHEKSFSANDEKMGGTLVNTEVSQEKHDDMMYNAWVKEHDCQSNGTPHPSENTKDMGYDKAEPMAGKPVGTVMPGDKPESSEVAKNVESPQNGSLPDKSESGKASPNAESGTKPGIEEATQNNKGSGNSVCGTTPDKEQEAAIPKGSVQSAGDGGIGNDNTKGSDRGGMDLG